jgi:2-polyprenyl-3-methyl-5-hydroxy-6-metoxy-1,4-benzoquinol methylase
MVAETEALYRTLLEGVTARETDGGGRVPGNIGLEIRDRGSGRREPQPHGGAMSPGREGRAAESAEPRSADSTARAAFEQFVRWTIEVERDAASRFLPAEECQSFLEYYRKLPAAGDPTAIRRYLRGMWRSEGGWTARWIASRRAAGRSVRVLDAGSGFGTYSMLFAAVGAEVTGVDLRPDRLSAAERRLRFHRESTGRELAVHYERADLTRRWPGDYDLVWVYNALSHIDPLEDFLRATRQHLRAGGVLVVGDINGAHPLHLRRLEKVRSEVHQEYVAPDGERHAYAVERPFPPAELRDIMSRQGMRVVHHELYWLGLGRLPGPLYATCVAPLQRWWTLGARVGRRQLLVATPAVVPMTMPRSPVREDAASRPEAARRA